MLKLLLIVSVIGYVAGAGASSSESNYFDIHVCGGSSVPSPLPLPGIMCNIAPTATQQPLRNGELDIITAMSSIFPVTVYRCHTVRKTSYCYKHFWGVPERMSWSSPVNDTLSSCQDRQVRSTSGSQFLSVVTPPYSCSWMREVSESTDSPLFEEDLAYYELLQDMIHIKGVGSFSTWANVSWYPSSGGYYFLPPESQARIRAYRLHSTHSTLCEVYVDRVRCPYLAITVWLSDLKKTKIINNERYWSVSEGVYISRNHKWDRLVETKKRTRRGAALQLQYVMDSLNMMTRAADRTAQSLRCEIKRLRRLTALAVASLSPALAAEIELGRRVAGVELTPAGLIKYSCQKVFSWKLQSPASSTHTEVPIVYQLYSSSSPVIGWLNPSSLTVTVHVTTGPPTRYVRVNLTHTFDLFTKGWVSVLPETVSLQAMHFASHGVISYLQDELELRAATSLSVINYMSRPTTQYRDEVPPSLTIYAQTREVIPETIRSTGTWLGKLVPKWLAIPLEILGSAITLALVVFIIYKIVPILVAVTRRQSAPRRNNAATEGTRERIRMLERR
ncbi:putative glycoprotein [Beihai barnacle virus 7]|uniref:Putative glycoprotein n=1 Tax=Beihai barnacle virus 7 TaxID=1922365 RepID=A0A1L3KMQ3_9RHAB|nr:putative glycoprotein [Beihai barnacle virus 7]APG78662.1 putative glycoprotein [Beihai barnacle virus 7]